MTKMEKSFIEKKQTRGRPKKKDVDFNPTQKVISKAVKKFIKNGGKSTKICYQPDLYEDRLAYSSNAKMV
jgi:hypothetical protein